MTKAVRVTSILEDCIDYRAENVEDKRDGDKNTKGVHITPIPALGKAAFYKVLY